MSAENVGKRCRWGSVRVRDHVCSGMRSPHEGEIVAFVPASASLREAQQAAYDAGKSSGEVIHVDAHPEAPFDRYLVREDREGAHGQPLKPRWYAPRASTVEVLP